MDAKNAQSYRNELEALLRKAEDAGYRLVVEIDVEVDAFAGEADVELDYFFQGPVASDFAHVNTDLLWEREL